MDQQQASITHCVCSGLSFAQIKQHADHHNIRSIKGLRSRLGMGAYCSACAPYLKQMLRSGQTEFDEPINEY
jgi:bacterioferritin-associated ferredoxin